MALLLKLGLNAFTYGATDVLYFEAYLAKIHEDGGVALYRDGAEVRCAQPQCHVEPFAHPPFIVHLLRGWDWLADRTGVPMRVWLRVTCALADLGSVFLVLGMVQKFRSIGASGVALVAMALCPVSVFVSGFHGNTDPIMMFLALLSVYLTETERPAFAAGAALGAAVSIKLTPLILLPLLILRSRSLQQKAAFVGAATTVFVIGGLPFVAQSPTLVLGRVFGYNPQMGPWGLGRLALLFQKGGQPERVDRVYAALKMLALGATLSVSLWMKKWHSRTPLLVQCGLVTSLFLALTPGFGVQYLAWVVPWTVALSLHGMIAFYLVSAAFMFTYYTVGSGGFPWYLANTLERPPWHGTVVVLGLICWVLMGILVGLYCQAVRRHRSI